MKPSKAVPLEVAMRPIRSLIQSIKDLVLLLEREAAGMRLACDSSAKIDEQSGRSDGQAVVGNTGAESYNVAGEAADRALARFLASVTPTGTRARTSEARAKATRLHVKIGGQAICRPKSADTFVEALRQMGLERVRDLGLHLCGVPLVSSRRPDGYQNARRVDGAYVVTHASNRAKKRLLERVARGLGMPIEVEVFR